MFDACHAAGIEVEGFLMPGEVSDLPLAGGRVIGGDDWLANRSFTTKHGFVVAIGDPRLRRKLTGKVIDSGARLVSVIHPRATLGSRVIVGHGTVILAGVVVNCDSVIGGGAILNTGARVDHDCRLGDGVHICPGAVLAGNVEVGDWSTIGAGATIINNVTIGSMSLIGAGSVVNKHLPDGVTAFGVPCRVRGRAPEV